LSSLLNGDRHDPILEGLNKGAWVKLLVAHFDGFQLIPAGAVCRWWNDPAYGTPSALSVARADPAPGYVDPYHPALTPA